MNDERNKRAELSSRDFGRLAIYTKEGGEEFVRNLNLAPGSRVLDVACGVGFQSIAAAKAGADVTGVDLDTELIAKASSLADGEGVRTHFETANAETLPYADGSFDVVMSVFGAMFASRPDRVAPEMHRVCRPGGLIAMANWTPDGIIGQMFRIVSRYVRIGGHWPFEWGRAAWARMCFGDAVEAIEFNRNVLTMSFPFPVSSVVDFWLTYCRPIAEVYSRLGVESRTDLRLDLEWFWSGHNISADKRSTLVEAEYLELKASKRRERSLSKSTSHSRISLPSGNLTLATLG